LNGVSAEEKASWTHPFIVRSEELLIQGISDEGAHALIISQSLCA